jgi:RepB plasmid partitioning protein/ParB/Sulfiredoxin domain
MNCARIGFEMRKIKLSLENILPIRQVKEPEKNIRRYKTIVMSIKEQGLVEPLVVYPQKKTPLKYILLDGHLRRLALMELGQASADCIISKDDESFTYNARISRVAPIQEHQMMMKAIRHGVKPERIAVALSIPLREVHAFMNLLDGIHKEAVELLKDKNIVPKTIRLLRRVTAARQIEIAELMVSANNFTTGYAEILIMATSKDQLTNPDEPKMKTGMSPEDVARMEQEIESLGRDVKTVEKTYGENTLNLTLARGYIKKLLDNVKVVRFLNANHADIFSEFEAIIAAESL